MEEKFCNEKRAALIAALIAIPGAIFISMAVHHFVPVEERFPTFEAGEVVVPPPGVKGKGAPLMDRPPRTPGMKKAPAKSGLHERRNSLLALAQKKAALAERNLELAKKLCKTGKVKKEELILLTEKSLLAAGELYRFENRIRSFRASISDLAVRHESAKKLRELAKKKGASALETGKLEYEELTLTFQLKSNRLYTNENWKKAYDDYCKTPGKTTYINMLKIEREATPRRRF